MKNREKKLLILTIAVAVTAAVYAFAVEPLARTYAENARMIRFKEQQLSRSRFLLEQSPKLRKSFAAWFERGGSERLLVEDTAAMLTQTEKLAAQNGVNILSVKPQMQRMTRGMSAASLDLDTEATIRDLCRFLYALEYDTNWYRVRRLSIYGRNAEGKLRAGIQVNSKS